MATSTLNTGVRVDVTAFKSFAKALRLAAPELATELRKGLRAAGEAVAALARARAEYSTRIPSSIKVQVRNVGVAVVAGGSKAPNASPIENRGKGYVRHPVFVPKNELPGPPGSWTSDGSHPAFLSPAVEDGRNIAFGAAIDALDKAVASIPTEFGPEGEV
jgi:hypothetical protein